MSSLKPCARQARDARQPQPAEPLVAVARPAPRPFAEPRLAVLPSVMPVDPPVVTVVEQEVVAEAAIPVLVEAPALEPALPLVDVHLPAPPVPPATVDGRPAWAAEPFECLLFDVAGLTLAVPLVCLGSIYTLAGQELTPLFGQPEWFLGIPCQAGNLKVLDTARWVMPDRYRDDFRQGLQYVISVQGYEWGWPCTRSAVRCAWTRRKSSGAASVASARGWPARLLNTCVHCSTLPRWPS